MGIKFYHQYEEESCPSLLEQHENVVVSFSLPESGVEHVCILNGYILDNVVIGSTWFYKGHSGVFTRDSFVFFKFSQSAISEMFSQFGEVISGEIHVVDVLESGWDAQHSQSEEE